MATLPVKTSLCDASGEDQFVDFASDQRRPGRAFAWQDLKNVIGNPRRAQQRLQFERNQRRQLGGLEHDGIARHQRRHGLSRRNRERIIPRRDDSDHAIRLMQNAP